MEPERQLPLVLPVLGGAAREVVDGKMLSLERETEREKLDDFLSRLS